MRKLLIFLLIPFLLFAETVYDAVDGNDMTTHNQCAVVPGGIIANCSNYDGTADWMDCSDNANLDFTNCDFTIQAWVHSDVSTGVRWIIMKKGEVSDIYINYGLAVGTTNKVLLKISTTGYNSQKTITAHTWFHIICVFDYNPVGNNTAHFYINYNTKASISKSKNPTANNNELVIGKHMSVGTPSDYEWDGKIDEIGIWNRTLSDAEASSLYNGGAGLAYDSFTAGLLSGLVSYWSHDYEPPTGAGQIIQTKISR